MAITESKEFTSTERLLVSLGDAVDGVVALTSDVVSVDEQAFEKHDEADVDEDDFEVVDETPEFQATVDMEVQAKVDSNHPDARVEAGPDHMFGKTLEQEERIQAREAKQRRSRPDHPYESGLR